jgi:putative ABC transport system ATP-binding protein
MTLIKLSNLNKHFHFERLTVEALRDINLSIDAGEFMSIMGPSGSGKSTLLSIIGMLDTPDSGSYFFANKDTHRLNHNELADLRNEDLGFVFQSLNLLNELTVYDNIALPMRISRKKHKNAYIDEKVSGLLEQINLTHRAEQYPAQLSGGQQQLVAIARAIANEPAVLLLDEPTGNLDSANGEAVMALLQQLNTQGVTLCMVTHDSDYAARASRQLKIVDGQLYDIE